MPPKTSCVGVFRTTPRPERSNNNNDNNSFRISFWKWIMVGVSHLPPFAIAGGSLIQAGVSASRVRILRWTIHLPKMSRLAIAGSGSFITLSLIEH